MEVRLVSMGHMLRYHLLVPAGIFTVLLVIGVPLGTAFVVGMMTGCMSMMVMMGRGAVRPRDHSESVVERRDRDRSR